MHNTAHQYWRHDTSGDIFAVKLQNGTVVGVCGPLYYKEITDDTLPNFHYHDNPEDIDWLNEHADEFVCYEGRYQEED